MATFLELVRATELDSGTMPTQLGTVSGATGRHARFVGWVRDAYEIIQRERTDWRWLRKRFSAALTIGVREYDAATLGISDRFRSWVYGAPTRQDFSLYTAAIGKAGEGWLTYVPWEEFRQRFLLGAAEDETGTPTVFTIDGNGWVQVYPIPDEDCTLRGEYNRAPQTLTADGDIPEMPETYHAAIKWQALMLMGEFDEATEQNPYWLRRKAEVLGPLYQEHLPRLEVGGAPLA